MVLEEEAETVAETENDFEGEILSDIEGEGDREGVIEEELVTVGQSKSLKAGKSRKGE